MIEITRREKHYQCPCGKVSSIYYDGDYRQVRDLPFGEWDLYLVFFQVRVNCQNCGVKTEQLDWVDRTQRHPKRFAAFVARLCKMASCQAVSEWVNEDWKTVKRFDKQALTHKWKEPNLAGLRVLAVDEIALKKGHQYATVILDVETKRVVWMVEGRTEESLESFYQLLGPERCKKIKAVAMDMWKPFMNATQEYCPQAEIVFDPFHILSNYSKVINQVRNAEAKKAQEHNKAVYKGTQYLLLKNQKNVRGKKRIRLKELLALNHRLNTVYVLKEDLKHLWDYTYPKAAWNWFRDWYHRAIYSKIEPVKKFARSLKAHWDGIVSHCQYDIHTSLLEGVNNKIKVIKRMAYGFHDMDYFFLKVRDAFPGKT